jgi:hypothetical protein
MKCFVRTRHSGQLILQHPAADNSLSYKSGSSNLQSVPDNKREGSQRDSIEKDYYQKKRKIRHSGLQTPTITHFGMNKRTETADMLNIQRRRYLYSWSHEDLLPIIINYYNNANDRSNDEYDKSNDGNDSLRSLYIPEPDRDSTNTERLAKTAVPANEKSKNADRSSTSAKVWKSSEQLWGS